jgi:hypothetical protein
MERGLKFLKRVDLDCALEKMKWTELPPEDRRCVVCKSPLTPENIGALLPGSTKAVCNDFICVMVALLKEKKELLCR